MSKLLINEPPIMVQPSLAKTIGLNEAIVLQQVHYWLENPKTGVLHDGQKWVHNTYKEWQENFPFWSIETVKRTIKSLEDSGLLVSAQFSPNPFDKTKAYRVQYEALDEVKLTPSITETTISDTKYGESSTSPIVAPIEWQIVAGAKSLVTSDQRQAQMKDSANMIAMGSGSLEAEVRELAFWFMATRDIIIPLEDSKGNRAVAKKMIKQGVRVRHVQEAVEMLLSKNMTVVDLYSVAKTAIALANPSPEQNEHPFLEGV